MAFDPSVISSIPDNTGNPVRAVEQGLQLKDMVNQEHLQALQTGATEREAKDNAQVQQILKDSDYSTPQGLAATVAKVNKVSPAAAMNLMKYGQSYQSGQVKAQIDQLTLAGKRQDLIVSAIDPIVAQARQMKNQGASDLDVRAFITQQMPNAIRQLRGQQLPDGKPALPDDQLQMVLNAPGGYTLATLESWEGKSKSGQAAIANRIKQLQADTAQSREQESVRHDKAMEGLSAQKAAASQIGGPAGDLLAALADKGVSLPAGFRSQQSQKALLSGLIRRHPDMTADQIADGIVSGKLKFTAETKGASVAGTQIGKVALATNELDTFGDQVLAASKDLSRAPVGLTLRGLLQMGEKQASSTGLLTLKLKLQALENAYDQLAARGGTDADKRAHIASLFDARLTDAGIQALVTGVKQEAEGARAAADRTIAETSGAAIPGTGPAGGAAPSGTAAAVAQPAGVPGAPPTAAATPAGSGKVVDWSDLQ